MTETSLENEVPACSVGAGLETGRRNISKFHPQRCFNKFKQQFDGACLGPGNNCRVTRKGSGEAFLSMHRLLESSTSQPPLVSGSTAS
ncbi:hypothetical protein AMECASPLE_037390 [Ameca splendens]|uniref:Uncharacterized protein n=1 Tax=Ameca splendens TaxID=208324 RepID=A0ABV0Z5S3_9TELE